MTERRRLAEILVFLAIWATAAAYVSPFVYRGWIPHDEGTLGQSAERALNGELPHRDFDELYTGGLTYLHAAAFKAGGTNLRSIRVTLYVFFLAFVPAVYAIARRFGSIGSAAFATALAVVWSVPNYFAGLPSWYNLFFAVFGTLALIRFADTGRRGYLVAAGLAGGLSILAKISGAYYVAAGLLFLAYLEQLQSKGTSGRPPTTSRFRFVVAGACGMFLVLLYRLLSSRQHASEVVVFFGPLLILCGFVVWGEWTRGQGAIWRRSRSLLSLAGPFLAGAAVPLVAFVTFYWQHDAVGALVDGVFVLPQRRLVEAGFEPPPLGALALAVPYALFLLWRPRSGTRLERWVPAVLLGVAGLLWLAENPIAYRATWAVARSLPLLAAVVAVSTLAARARDFQGTAATSASVFLLVVMAANVALIQFPYSTPTYFCYAAPLIALALVALVNVRPEAPKRLHLSVGVFFLAFGMLFVNRSYGWNLGVAYVRYNPTAELALERGGLRVPETDKRDYEAVVRLVRTHVQGGTIYAGPDCPEVYFLAGMPNPGRAIFEFLTPQKIDASWMTDRLAGGSIRGAVINTAPQFSAQMDPSVVAILDARFPSYEQVGRFIVRWRD